MKKHILFVDDEPHLLQGLRRMLRSMQHAWNMAFAGSGKEALDLLERSAFDVVVSDMRMPGMDGTQLLNEIRQRYPRIVRIILSGHSDRTLILKSVGPTHQFLAKPCDAERLKVTLSRACALGERLSDETLKELATGMQNLPSLPYLYHELSEALQAPDETVQRVGEIIARDLGMSAKVLQLVNSAFFGRQQHVSSPIQAVNLLGLDTLQALIASVEVFSCFDAATLQDLCIDDLWSHSLAVGTLAKDIVREKTGQSDMVDDALTAGLLHDVGKLMLSTHLPNLYQQTLTLVQKEGLVDWQAERAILGATHAEIGGYLLGLWGLPDRIVEAVTYHHDPSVCSDQAFSPLTAVQLAEAIVEDVRPVDTAGHAAPVDGDDLTRRRLHRRLPSGASAAGCSGVTTTGDQNQPADGNLQTS